MKETQHATLQAGARNDEGHKQEERQNYYEKLPQTPEELQSILQAEGDRRVTQALKTAGIKWRQKMIRMLAAERSEAERLARHTVEKREREVLELYGKELEEKERALKYKELELKVMAFLLEKKLPVELKDFVLSQDEETSLQKAEELGRLWKRKLQEVSDTRAIQ